MSWFNFVHGLNFSGALAREARQRSTMGKKIWETIHPRKFGYDVATPVHSLRGREGNQVSARPGEEYVINRAMHLCNPPFSWREIAQEMAWLSSRSKTCLLQLLHCIRIL